VTSLYRPIRGVGAIGILIQSDVKSPLGVSHRIEEFLKV